MQDDIVLSSRAEGEGSQALKLVEVVTVVSNPEMDVINSINPSGLFI